MIKVEGDFNHIDREGRMIIYRDYVTGGFPSVGEMVRVVDIFGNGAGYGRYFGLSSVADRLLVEVNWDSWDDVYRDDNCLTRPEGYET